MARALAAHGLRGELKCRRVTDFPDRFRPGLRLALGAPPRWYTLRRARAAGDLVYLSLEGVDDRSTAESLAGAEVRVAGQDAVALPPGQFFWHQVIGLRVQDPAGRPLGSVTDILTTGANDVYVVRGPRGEILVPAIKEVVRSIDPAAGRMVIDPLPGLLPRGAGAD